MAVTGKEAVTLEQLKSLSGLGGGGISEIPIATEDTLGGVKVGENVSVDETGVLTAQTATLEEFKEYMGGSVNEDGSVSSYELPIASSTVLGGVKIGEGISVTDDGTISSSGGRDLSDSVDGETIAYSQKPGGSKESLHVPEGGITSKEIKDGAVTSQEIADYAVESKNIANAAVTDEKLSSELSQKINEARTELWSGSTNYGQVPVVGIRNYKKVVVTLKSSDGNVSEVECFYRGTPNGIHYWSSDLVALPDTDAFNSSNKYRINELVGVAFISLSEDTIMNCNWAGSSNGYTYRNGSSYNESADFSMTKIEGVK